MTHQQILDKISAKHLILSIDEDVALLTFYAMAYDKTNSTSDQLAYILPKLLLRWNCILNAEAGISDIYKQKTVLALAIILHKYGFADKAITDNALKAMDDLNKGVVLSDDFFRKSDEIKAFLTAAPVPLKRKPAMPDNITFYRPKDVVSIQLQNKYYIAYIHELTGPNESPVVEFYNEVFNKVPTLNELENVKAKGQIYNDGKEKIARYAVSGMKFLPDLANQVQLISACVEKKPSGDHLEKPQGLYTVGDIMQIQEDIMHLFY